MDIYEFAMNMEKDGEAFYRTLAERNLDNPGLAKILNMLADEEVKHFEIIQQLGSKIPTPVDSKLLDGAKNIFAQMKDKKENFSSHESDIEIYRKAQELEQRSCDFYKEIEEESEDDWHKNVFHKMAEEEERHYVLLENIIQFITKPAAYLENAEWRSMDEY